uniref:(northern house mosquito) hypothetical protein n=1 Tax=Culex pipiens TaxID=7175 RepID=A0A8D8L5E3_CULPI
MFGGLQYFVGQVRGCGVIVGGGLANWFCMTVTDARVDLPDVGVWRPTNAGRINLINERRHYSEPVCTGSIGNKLGRSVVGSVAVVLYDDAVVTRVHDRTVEFHAISSHLRYSPESVQQFQQSVMFKKNTYLNPYCSRLLMNRMIIEWSPVVMAMLS